MQRKAVGKLLSLSRQSKRAIVLGVDIILCILSVFLAFALRLDTWVIPQSTQWLTLLGALVFSIPVFIAFGLYRAIFRYAGWGALVAVVQACAVYGAVYSTVFTLVGITGVPRTIGIIQPILLFIGVGATRSIARYALNGGYIALLRAQAKKRVLIYGAGSAGRQLAAGLANSEEMQVIAFVDDDKTLHKSVLNGKVIYPSDNLPALISRLDIDDLLLAVPSATRSRRNEILEMVRPSPVVIRTLPGIMELAQGKVTVNDLKELDIEDLLGRDPVAPNEILLGKNIVGKTVLVTGAGGSIGSELCRQIIALRPESLVLVEMSEFALYSIHQELEPKISDSINDEPRLVPLLASVQDEVRMRAIISSWKPDTIYHAAAYKHVPLVESNVIEGVRNNVFGTYTTAKIAQEVGVSTFILISTDKAVRPTNVMGATKRVAEMVLQAMAAEHSGTIFSMVRFGNVLGSSGSVVPLFRKQIKSGGPITVTHEDVTRYFMTIPEAAQLVIQAGAMAKGGEVFVLDMGDPVRIIDLARRMIELSGLTLKDENNPSGDITVEVVGLRPGEKLYEELLIGDNPEQTGHSRIMKANEAKLNMQDLTYILEDISFCISQSNSAGTIELISKCVIGFSKRKIPESINNL
jgi:FlaA1/EpsC-like NDP-sugar epimerase